MAVNWQPIPKSKPSGPPITRKKEEETRRGDEKGRREGGREGERERVTTFVSSCCEDTHPQQGRRKEGGINLYYML